MKHSIESQVQDRARRDNIQKRITLLLARLTAQQGRLLFVTDRMLLKQLGLSDEERDPSYKIRQALQRLEKKGLVVRSMGVTWSARLTQKGKEFAEKADNINRLVKKARKWDGRWRIVIFDIWERRRPMRNKLRRTLMQVGFCRVQDSVWAYPYDCEELVAFLRAELRLGSSVLYLVAEGIEGDSGLKSHFGLN